MSDNTAPIGKISGKLQAAGVVLLAGGVVATFGGGAWWGPALILDRKSVV